MKQLIHLFLFTLFSFSPLFAQNGPGGVGDTTGLTSLQLWLRADDLVNIYGSNARIMTWTDQSGAANHVYGTTTQAPFFRTNLIPNRPCAQFNGSQYLQTDGDRSGFNNPESTIFVVKQGSFTGASVAIAFNNWSNEMLLFNQAQYHHSSSGNFWFVEHQCFYLVPENDISLVCGLFGQGTNDLRYFVNRQESNEMAERRGSPWDYTNVDRKVTIGQRASLVNSEYLNGNILEIIIYNEELNDEDRMKVETYLQDKYEIDFFANKSCVVSTEEPVANVQISLAPNPANELLTINIETNEWPNGQVYQIFDQLGRVISSGNINSTTIEVSTQSYPAGVYYFHTFWEEENVIRKFLVN